MPEREPAQSVAKTVARIAGADLLPEAVDLPLDVVVRALRRRHAHEVHGDPRIAAEVGGGRSGPDLQAGERAKVDVLRMLIELQQRPQARQCRLASLFGGQAIVVFASLEQTAERVGVVREVLLFRDKPGSLVRRIGGKQLTGRILRHVDRQMVPELAARDIRPLAALCGLHHRVEKLPVLAQVPFHELLRKLPDLTALTVLLECSHSQAWYHTVRRS